MMDFFSTIGIVAVVVLVGYFLLQMAEHVDDEYYKISHLVPHCDECKQYVKAGLTKENKKAILRVFMNPKIREEAVRRKQEEEEYNLLQKKQYEAMEQESRKSAYQYEEAIFTIFDVERQLSFDELTDRIRGYYRLQGNNEVLQIFTRWKALNLVGEVWARNSYNSPRGFDSCDWEITRILTSPKYKLAPSDLTRNEWLAKKGKSLQ